MAVASPRRRLHETDWPYYVLVHDPVRARDWQDVYGTRQVAVREPIIEYVHLPGYDRPQPVYMLAMGWLTREQRERLVAFIALRFKLPVSVVNNDLDRLGVPILATDTVLLVDGLESQPGRRNRNGVLLRLLMP